MKEFTPLYLDMAGMVRNLHASERSIETYVKQGLLPAPKRLGGKRIWLTTDVIAAIDGNSETGLSNDPLAERIRDATKAAARA